MKSRSASSTQTRADGVTKLIRAARKLARDVDALRFPSVAYVYNPLVYARAMHEQYIERFASIGDVEKRVLLIGMNPGPWGMAQTGVPFGEVNAVTSWMKLDAPVKKPKREHPKRLVSGLKCERSEVSGARLWGAIAKKHPDPSTFFATRFVVNYCPLLFLEESGANVTPDKLTAKERSPLLNACTQHLRLVLDVMKPEIVVGVGAWALQRVNDAVDDDIRTALLPHPSPASPAANSGWEKIAREALVNVDDELL